MISTVIFDLDGLLTDTERLHCQAWRQTLAGVGVDVSDAEFAEHWIRTGLGIEDFLRLRDLPHDPHVLRRAKFAVFATLVDTSLCAMPGALELVETLHGKKRLALATSSFRENAEMVLTRLDLVRYFEAIATSESAPRGKPHPDLFLY